MKPLVKFTAWGKPLPKGRMQGFVPVDRRGNPYRRESGSIMVNITDAGGARLTAWVAQIRQAAGQAYGGGVLRSTPVHVSAVFKFQRPKSHYGTGRNASVLKPSAPEHLVSKGAVYGDGDKLVRAVFDAMIGVMYVDDGQVVSHDARRIWTTEQSCVVVEVFEVDEASDNP